jgi:hypothetical protein
MRSLQVYAIDPSSGKYSENQVKVRIPWEALDPGPTGHKIAVVDYDATDKCYYPPIKLDNPLLLASNGLGPTEADPRFHQQMVYAIATCSNMTFLDSFDMYVINMILTQQLIDDGEDFKTIPYKRLSQTQGPAECDSGHVNILFGLGWKVRCRFFFHTRRRFHIVPGDLLKD